ncbi:MAG: hypothetical protein ACQERS_05590 [Bacteroidota bacterium]
MTYICRILLIISLSSVFLISRGQESECPESRVGVRLEEIKPEVFDALYEDYPGQSKEALLSQIDDWVVNEFQQRNTDLTFFSLKNNPDGDCEFILMYLIFTNAQNVVYDEEEEAARVYGNVYWVFGKLVNTCSCVPLQSFILDIKNSQDENIHQAIKNVAALHFPMGNRIYHWLREATVPVESPVLKIDLEKEYLSPLDEETRKMEVWSTVRDCRGLTVYEDHLNHPVYYPETIDRCEFEQSPGPYFYWMDIRGLKTAFISKNRKASGVYRLNEGIEPSTSRVKLKTCGLGQHTIVEEEEEIIIRGLKIDVEPNRKILHPDESTRITLTFYEEDPDGNRYPVNGKELEIKTPGLMNGKISPKSGHVTDMSGQVQLTYRAGDKDESVRFIAEYQPPEYPEKAIGRSRILVKPYEYDATLVLRKKVIIKEFTEQKEIYGRCDEEKIQRHKLDEQLEASIYVPLKLVSSNENPLFGQIMEYYQPLDVNLSSLNLSSRETSYSYSNITNTGCAQGGHETTVTTSKSITGREIENKEYATQNPWIITCDKETGKALKMIPAGYSVAYETDDTETMETSTWSDGGTEKDESKELDHHRHRFAVGPVGKEVSDPTVKRNPDWIKDYIEQFGVEVPANVRIPQPDQDQAIKKVCEDMLVSFGDGIHHFGGRATRDSVKNLEDGYIREQQTFFWEIRKRKKHR